MIKTKRILTFVLAIAISGQHLVQAQSLSSQSSASGGSALNTVPKMGEFTNIKSDKGAVYRVYAAGPEDAKNAIIFVHDYFGISDAVKESVERLGRDGYRVLAVDLYKGKSATANDAATQLMNAKDPSETKEILLTAIESLKRPGRKLASVGFSAGGVDAMNANLLAPDLFSATAIIYGGAYDKIEKERLGNLKSPVLAITGSLDDWPLQAALNFLAHEKDKSLELYVYPGADHGYAQPLFNGGKNLNAEATRITWMLLEDFLARNLK